MGYFVSVDYQLEVIDNQKPIVLSPFSIAEWDGFFRDVYHVYGHIHCNTDRTFSI